MPSNILADNIKKKLMDKNVSVRMLERNAGLKKSSVANIISGRSKNPTIATVLLIAKNFNCAIDELVGQDIVEKKRNINNLKKDPDTKIEANIFLDLLIGIIILLKQNKVKPNFKKLKKCLEEAFFYSVYGKYNRVKEEEFLLWLIRTNFSLN